MPAYGYCHVCDTETMKVSEDYNSSICSDECSEVVEMVLGMFPLRTQCVKQVINLEKRENV